MTSVSVSETAPDLLDDYLPFYDFVITEHLVIDAGISHTYRSTKELDFLTVRSPLLVVSMFVRGLPSKLRRHSSDMPSQLLLTGDSLGLPGWVHLGDLPDREVAFGAVGKFWKADIEWKDVPIEEFAEFAEPGWGKIGCHFLVRSDGPNRTVLSYECRTATTDAAARRLMGRYWWLIRPFVGHILRATLRTIAANAQRGAMVDAASGRSTT